jgi:hypothetical protein
MDVQGSAGLSGKRKSAPQQPGNSNAQHGEIQATVPSKKKQKLQHLERLLSSAAGRKEAFFRVLVESSEAQRQKISVLAHHGQRLKAR